MSVEPEGEGARVTLKTTVQLSGKAAAMSRGVIDDVSKRLVGTFAENLEGIVAAPGAAKAGGAEAAPPAAEELPVLPLAAGMAADRMRNPRVLAAVIGGALLLAWLIRRRS
jgi:hypothetical protein